MKNVIGEITVKKIVELRLQYYEKITQNINTELYEYNCGKLESYNKIYIDISELDERDFSIKYCKKVIEFSKKMDNENSKYYQEIDFQVGENNAIVEFLSIINPEFEYSENIEDYVSDNAK